MLNRLIANWVYGGFLIGLLLLVLMPLFDRSWDAALTATFLCLPLYMLHQYEEHDDDRFRKFVNQIVGQGHEVLTTTEVFVINVPGVWGVIAASLWLAATVNAGFGLIAVYLVLVNAIAHIAGALASRRYNPGLITAIVLFVPAGLSSLMRIEHAAGTMGMNVVGLGIALLIHALILGRVQLQRRQVFRTTI